MQTAKTSSRALQALIPQKANKILQIVLFVMALILLRSWHLAVVQHEKRLEQASRPKIRSIIERAERACIVDRFNQVLAMNKVQFNASVVYAHIQEIPPVVWRKNAAGQRQKIYQRREYIVQLSQFLAKELQMRADEIEDLIHSKAALFPNSPFVIKEDIHEREYFRLKMAEKDFLGLYAERASKRFYPKEKLASHVVGYMGAISQEEYQSIVKEIQELKESLRVHLQDQTDLLVDYEHEIKQLRQEIEDLEKKAYGINDYVGKRGIEASFDQTLRGFYGKKIFQTDARGNFLKNLAGSYHAMPGQRVVLSISAELQEFAEELLAQNEEIRQGRSTTYDANSRTYLNLKQPWIKGGSIVAMDPKNGQILALASYPRFDPNDFIPSANFELRKTKNQNIRRWFESSWHIADIWDGKVPWKRERFDSMHAKFYEEGISLTWDQYLDAILAEKSPLRKAIDLVGTLSNAIYLQKQMKLYVQEGESCIAFFNAVYPEHSTASTAKMELEEAVKKSFRENLGAFFSGIENNRDKVFLLDLCRLALDENRFSEDLMKKCASMSLAAFRSAEVAKAILHDVVQEMAKELFEQLHFQQWRSEHGRDFLKQKRSWERENKTYARPYIDYFEKEKNRQFSLFWKTYRLGFLMTFLNGEFPDYLEKDLQAYFEHFKIWHEELSQGAHAFLAWNKAYFQLKEILKAYSKEQALAFLQTMRDFSSRKRPLLARYPSLRSENGIQQEKHLAAAFYPLYGFGFARSHAYRQACVQGSVFKLLVAYEALCQRYFSLKEQHERLNPLEIIDQVNAKGKSLTVAYRLDGEPISQYYKGGRIPRSERRNVGRIDLVEAIEVSSNPYFSLLAGDFLLEPNDLNMAARKFSFGEKTGIELPGEYAGRLPEDLNENRTGLYAYAIGQHSLTVTPLQTAVLLSGIVNGGNIYQATILRNIQGKRPSREDEKIFSKDKYAFQEALSLLGLDFPVFTAMEQDPQEAHYYQNLAQLKRKIPMPQDVQNLLLKGMYQVVNGKKGSARPSLLRNYNDYPHYIQDYKDLSEEIAGKTSTSESVERIDLDAEMGVYRYKHIWFAASSFEGKKNFEKPELVVIVYLRFGDYGREAAPLAAQMVKKWREIQDKHKDLRSPLL